MKTIIKKVLAVLLCIAFAVGSAPAVGLAQLTVDANAFGNHSEASFDYTYNAGILTIKGTGTVSGVIWTNTVASGTKKIIISEGITGIDDYIFSLNEYPVLESVSLPKSLTSIGAYAFSGCTSMKTVTFASGIDLTTISIGAFYDCGLTYVSIPSGIKTIGGLAFSNCKRLSTVVIPSSVTTIGDNAFAGCNSLSNISIGDNITSIGKYVFYDTAYTYNSKNYEDGVLYVGKYAVGFAERDAVGYDYDQSKCVIRQGTKLISDYAFDGNTIIKEVVLPISVAIIGDSAFYRCSNLKTAYLYCTAEEWNNVIIRDDNTYLVNARKYFEYSPDGVMGLEIETYPDKMSYFIYEDIDTTGLSLTVSYFDESTETVSSGFICDPETFEEVGQKTVRVYYKNKAVSFEVSVAARLTRIEVNNKNPNKPYYEGDSFDTSTVDVTAYYNDGTSRVISDSEYTFAPEYFETEKNNTVTISFDGMTSSFTVKVRKLLLAWIEVEELPEKTEYFDGDTLNTAGLKIRKYYNSGASEILDDTQVTCTPSLLTGSGKKTITVAYQGQTDTFEVNVTPVMLSQIEVNTLPDKTEYCLYDNLEPAGLTVKLIYNNGSTEIIDEGFSCAPLLLSEKGNFNITVSYEDKTTNFDVAVEAVIDFIDIIETPEKTEYFVGDSIDTTGLVLKIVYINHKYDVVYTDYTCNIDVFEEPGYQAITVTYGGKTDDFYVDVIPVVVEEIEIVTLPDKLDYWVGETLDTTGLTVKAIYNSGKVETVDSGFVCDPTEFTTAGEHTITVTYGGKTAEFKVNLTAVLTEIKVTTLPEKLEYFVGDSLVTTGIVVTAYYNDNTTVDLTDSFTCTPELMETAGKQTVTVTYEGKTAEFDVNVTAVVIDRIEIITAPTKTEYFTEDKLDTTGLTFKAIYNNGKEEVIDSGFTCDVDVFDKAGEQTVTVTYDGKTDTFNVNVTLLAVDRIEIITKPDKLDYWVGENLNTTGLTVKAIYNSGKVETVDSGFVCDPTEFTTAGEHTITVTYEGKTAEF
ncbi:MAG: bacterial Ig-like domain-containing protein, partial [Clostridiales bacterium]|nr:bacterial Ig-like domain-containing protein [Clostridiales bacterium]